jgi:hypothetical protein
VGQLIKALVFLVFCFPHYQATEASYQGSLEVKRLDDGYYFVYSLVRLNSQRGNLQVFLAKDSVFSEQMAPEENSKYFALDYQSGLLAYQGFADLRFVFEVDGSSAFEDVYSLRGLSRETYDVSEGDFTLVRCFQGEKIILSDRYEAVGNEDFVFPLDVRFSLLGVIKLYLSSDLYQFLSFQASLGGKQIPVKTSFDEKAGCCQIDGPSSFFLEGGKGNLALVVTYGNFSRSEFVFHLSFPTQKVMADDATSGYLFDFSEEEI